MKLILEPTEEMYQWPATLPDGRPLMVRIWNGQTEGGIRVWSAILSTVPDDVDAYQRELPEFMRGVMSRDVNFVMPPRGDKKGQQ